MHDPTDTKENGSGLSRREFLHGSSVAAAASALTTTALPALAEADAPARPAAVPEIGPGQVQLALTVNGRRMTTRIEPRVTLLDALRNYLDVTGCKRVCDRGTCGACTVMLDGKVVYSCSMLALEAQGKAIRTAESLVHGEELDAVPAAFVHADAQQCGFCTPGFVVAMKAVLEQNPRATPQEVEAGLAGNICRCGTYEQMRDAIAALCHQPRRRG
jgi:xanthine dehydrogenase YagT iron-sulfur-binding subunit